MVGATRSSHEHEHEIDGVVFEDNAAIVFTACIGATVGRGYEGDQSLEECNNGSHTRLGVAEVVTPDGDQYNVEDLERESEEYLVAVKAIETADDLTHDLTAVAKVPDEVTAEANGYTVTYRR